MARGKHLFPYRTQKLSLVAVTILLSRENSTVPSYVQSLLFGRLFTFRRGTSSPNARDGRINRLFRLFSPECGIDFRGVNPQIIYDFSESVNKRRAKT